MYILRGRKLKHLSLYDYSACIRLNREKKSRAERKQRHPTSNRFAFDKDDGIPTKFSQIIRAPILQSRNLLELHLQVILNHHLKILMMSNSGPSVRGKRRFFWSFTVCCFYPLRKLGVLLIQLNLNWRFCRGQGKYRGTI